MTTIKSNSILTNTINIPESNVLSIYTTPETDVMTSSNGEDWTSRVAAEANAWYGISWSPELSLFVVVSYTGTNRIMTSPDGIIWTSRSATEANNWFSVTWSPELGIFVAVSFNGTNRVMYTLI